LQIGGVIPQAYIVAMPTKDGMKPTLIPTVDGYRFVALSDPPILKDFFISAVYEKEVESGFRIDMPNGKVEGHFVFLGPDRGKMIGVYAILTHLDNTKTAQWMPIQDIENVRNHHSPSWKAYKNDKMSADKCAWVTDADMMAIKTAGKRFLEPYVALKEGLQMVLNIDEDDTTNGAQEQDKRPIVDRVGDRLDDIIETTAKVEMTAEEPKAEVKQNGQDNKDGSLF
jgi:recombinational DNA repair protein RecT